MTHSETDGLGAWDLLEFRADQTCVANWIWEGRLEAIGYFSFRRKSSVSRDGTLWSRLATSPHRYYTEVQADRTWTWLEQGEMVFDGSFLVSADGNRLTYYLDADPIISYQRSNRPVVRLDEGGNPTAVGSDTWGGVKRHLKRADCPCVGPQPSDRSPRVR